MSISRATTRRLARVAARTLAADSATPRTVLAAQAELRLGGQSNGSLADPSRTSLRSIRFHDLTRSVSCAHRQAATIGVGQSSVSRQRVRAEPLDRSLLGLVDRVGGTKMGASIALRPLIVERGRFDYRANDCTADREHAKVWDLYASRPKISWLTEFQYFDTKLQINGKGRFRFLLRHLNWPEPGSLKTATK